jgi:hypothetical protein
MVGKNWLEDAHMIELTAEQAQAQEEQKAPLQVRNPRTREIYVLVRQDVYELTCGIIGGGPGQVWDDEADEGLIRKQS